MEDLLQKAFIKYTKHIDSEMVKAEIWEAALASFDTLKYSNVSPDQRMRMVYSLFIEHSKKELEEQLKHHINMVELSKLRIARLEGLKDVDF